MTAVGVIALTRKTPRAKVRDGLLDLINYAVDDNMVTVEESHELARRVLDILGGPLSTDEECSRCGRPVTWLDHAPCPESGPGYVVCGGARRLAEPIPLASRKAPA